MPFLSEKEFERDIRQIITDEILPLNGDLILLNNKKAVDILICKNGAQSALYFIEIKYHKNNHGRLGTGHGKGGGIQPEILKIQPDYFKTKMYWILGTENEEGYWIINNTDILKYISGGGIGTKYNNIQNKIFKETTPISKLQLIALLRDWLI